MAQIFTLHDNTSSISSRFSQNEQSETVLTQQLSNGDVRTITLNAASNLSLINEFEEESSEQTSVIIIQPPSSVTRIASNQHYDESLINTVEQNGNQTLRRRFMVSESSRLHQFSLSLSSVNPENNNSSNDDINSIYRFLCSNVDNEMAIAATIAMYSLRLSVNGSGPSNSSPQTLNRDLTVQTSSNNVVENISNTPNLPLNNQQILVSQVSMSIESNDIANDNEQNLDVVISYDNLENVSQTIPSTYIFDSSSSFSSEQQSTSLSNSSFISDISMEINSSTFASRNSLIEIPTLSPEANDALGQNENDNNTSGFSSCNNNSVNESTSSFKNGLNIFGNNNNQNNNGDGDENYSSEIEGEFSGNISPTIRLKFLDDTQRLVKTLLETSVGDFKKKHFSDLLANGKVIRLIFQGQLLRDDSRSLASYGVRDKCAVHCHVGNRPYQQSNLSTANPSVFRRNNDLNRFETESNNNTNQENTQISSTASMIGSRIISIGYSWIELLLLIFWNSLVILWNWAQNIDENNNQTEENNESHSWRHTIVNNAKSVVRMLLSCIFDSRTFSQHLNGRFGDDETNYAFNVGNILGLLVIIKFLSLWFVVFYYPQFMDFKGVFLLAILTATTALYFRARTWVQNADLPTQ